MSHRKLSPVVAIVCFCVLAVAGSRVWASDGHEPHSEGEQHAADDAHDSKHHLAILLGMAYEETADGHHEDGNMAGLEYLYHLNHRWGVGAAIEGEVFGDEQKRNAVVVVPVSHFRGNWRLFAGPGVELRKEEKTEFVFRLGVGYNFHINKRLTISPEAQVDFIENGTQVYVLTLAFGVSL